MLIAALAVAASHVPAIANPATPELLAQAREAASTDRNRESARLFAHYLAENPGERRAILRELADQLLYSDRPDEALDLYEEGLSWDLSPEERLQAQRGYALALLWSGRNRRAAQAYDNLLAANPGEADLAFNRIRAVQWLGRPDVAAGLLARLPADLRSSKRAAEIGADLRKSARPLTEAGAGAFSQADGLEMSSWHLEQRFYALSGSAMIAPSLSRRTYRQSDGGRVEIDAPGAEVRWRMSDTVEVSGQFALERQRGSGVSRTLNTYQGSIAIMPSDSLRFDLVAARRSLDNLKSLQIGISTRHYFGSVDYWPDTLLKLTLRGEATQYSDGNDRRWGQLEAERRLSREPNIFIGLRATAFRFERQLDHGYFNPKSFRSLQLTGRGWSRVAERTWIDISAAAGPEDSSPGGTKLAYWLRGKVSQGLGERVELSLIAERLSAGQTATGFARNSVSGAVRVRW